MKYLRVEGSIQDKRAGVYLIQNIASAKVYVGSAANLRQRHGEHQRQLRRQAHDNPHLQHGWDKHGESAFTFRVLLYSSVDDLLFYEQRAIEVFTNSHGWRNLYNCAPTAGSNRGLKHSAEVRARMSANNTRPFKGRHHAPETRALLSRLAKERAATPEGRAKYFGHVCSEERKAKIGAANRGRIPSEETRRKLSAASKGRVVSDETRRKIALIDHSGWHHSEETRARLSALNKNRAFSAETRKRISDGVKAAYARRRTEGP